MSRIDSKHPYKIRHIHMTEEEQQQWIRQWATLAIDSFIEKYGYLPRPPTDAEAKRILESLGRENPCHCQSDGQSKGQCECPSCQG